MSHKRSSNQKLYTFINQDLQEIEKIIFDLEKKYFSLNPLFDILNIKLNKLIDVLRKEKIYALLRKIKAFKKEIKILSIYKGYEPEVFQKLFKSLKKTNKESIIDIIARGSLKSRITFFKNKIEQNEIEELAINSFDEEKLSSDNIYKQLLMVSDNNTNFVIPIKARLWQRKIIHHAYRDHLKIKFNMKTLNQLYSFTSLTLGFRNKSLGYRFAILLSDEDDCDKGVLVDKVHGTIYLNSQLFSQKIEYLNIDSEVKKAFIRLQGRRYFIKKL